MISLSETSYGNRLNNGYQLSTYLDGFEDYAPATSVADVGYFTSFIHMLVALGSRYAPKTKAICIDHLNILLKTLVDINQKVILSYGRLKPLQDQRLLAYQELAAVSTAMKASVKAQYGVQSPEYKLIKGLRV